MKETWALPLISTTMLLAVWCMASSARADDRVGMREDFSTAQGWFEIGPDDAKITPRAKMEVKDGLLYIHTNRGLLSYMKRLDREKWPLDGIMESSFIHKDYGEVDLDKFHYLVLKIREKGSGATLSINGFQTKLGYTTGITAIDLKDYDNDKVHGKQKVHISIDLHDNLTTLVLEELKLVSQLSEEEQKGFLDAGLTIRDEKLSAKPYHGLEELKRRENTPPPLLDGEEMTIFRDTATGAISMRLTAAAGDNYIGEGGIWSLDGGAMTFETVRKLGGSPVYYLAQNKLITVPKALMLWSNVEPSKLFLVASTKPKNDADPWKFSVSMWDHKDGQTTHITDFEVPQVGSFFEVKRLTRSGKLLVAFRETPYMYVIDPVAKKATEIKLSTRLKDSSLSADEQFVFWANCYTYEMRWRNLKTGEEGVHSETVVGHACHGPAGTVGSFGPYLKIFVPADLGVTRTPGDRIKVWANWQNQVYTDYGSFTADKEWIFTNGTKGDVANQHVMVPSKDTGAVLRIARYFTKFSWTSPTYNRPSPDYTKLVYCDNCIGSSQMILTYTRRTDAPVDVKLDGDTISWQTPARHNEIKGYNVYQSKTSGRDFVKINDDVITGTSYKLPNTDGFFAVTSVENSTLESMFSAEVGAQKARTIYYQAEEQQLTPPARPFYDGYCNNFQCVRINAESAKEKQTDGVVKIDLSAAPAGKYAAWALVSGKGEWTVQGKAVPVDSDQFKWVKLAQDVPAGPGQSLSLSSRDDSLKVDTVMITTEDFTPAVAEPRDCTPPAAVKNLTAKVDAEKGHVTLNWDKSADKDFHHYSVYCGADKAVACDNASVIRSVFKTSVTDAGMAYGRPLVYKVVAYDSRWNASEPTIVEVQPIKAPPAPASQPGSTSQEGNR